MRGLLRALGIVFLFIWKAIWYLIRLPFVAILYVLGLMLKAIWYLIRLPFIVILYVFECISPNYRRQRLHMRFTHTKEELQRRAEADRQSLSTASARKNAAELADLVLAALRSRHRDIAPSLFDEARLLIRKCAEKADVQTLTKLIEIITRMDRRHINNALIEVGAEKIET